MAFRIRFISAVDGKKQTLPAPEYAFHEMATAETLAEHLTHGVDNPAWNGKFEAFEEFDGKSLFTDKHTSESLKAKLQAIFGTPAPAT